MHEHGAANQAPRRARWHHKRVAGVDRDGSGAGRAPVAPREMQRPTEPARARSLDQRRDIAIAAQCDRKSGVTRRPRGRRADRDDRQLAERGKPGAAVADRVRTCQQ